MPFDAAVELTAVPRLLFSRPAPMRSWQQIEDSDEPRSCRDRRSFRIGDRTCHVFSGWIARVNDRTADGATKLIALERVSLLGEVVL